MPEETQAIAAKARIEITDKNMKAYLVFEESGVEHNQMPEMEIYQLLEKAQVKNGIKHEEILDISLGKKEGARFLIAEGTPAKPGKDGYLEFYFDTESSFKPKILDDGRIDYKEVNLVKSVSQDSLLIKKIPSTVGIKGMDLFGKELFAFPGKSAELNMGQGVYKDHKDPNLIKASVDGIIFYDAKRKSLEVQKLYLVNKSVDYSTGNINVKSSVDIHGDVKPYFTITTPYNVQVKGIIDNGVVNSGGALQVVGGIVGDGKQWIKTGGDIHSAYINNHQIKCGGSVYITSEIRNSIIECDNEVVMVRDTGVMIGGRISASNKISAGIAGNTYGVRTELEAGVKMEHKEKYYHLDTERKAMLKKVEELKDEINKAEERDPDDKKYLDPLYGRLEECQGMYDKAIRDIKELEAVYYNVADPVIQVSKKVYPGVVIKIKHACFEVTEEMTYVKFMLEGGNITHTSM